MYAMVILNNLKRFAIFFHLHCLRVPVAPHHPSDASKRHRGTIQRNILYYLYVSEPSAAAEWVAYLLHLWMCPELQSEPATLAYVVFCRYSNQTLV